MGFVDKQLQEYKDHFFLEIGWSGQQFPMGVIIFFFLNIGGLPMSLYISP